jgi:hypothetical protein
MKTFNDNILLFSIGSLRGDLALFSYRGSIKKIIIQMFSKHNVKFKDCIVSLSFPFDIVYKQSSSNIMVQGLLFFFLVKF